MPISPISPMPPSTMSSPLSSLSSMSPLSSLSSLSSMVGSQPMSKNVPGMNPGTNEFYHHSQWPYILKNLIEFHFQRYDESTWFSTKYATISTSNATTTARTATTNEQQSTTNRNVTSGNNLYSVPLIECRISH